MACDRVFLSAPYLRPPSGGAPWRRALLALLWLPLSACLGNAGSLHDAGGLDQGGSLAPNVDTPTDGSGALYDGETTGIHRLNAEEYDATVRDLLGTKLSFAPSFLRDEVANGFDNNAAALTMTSARLQTYQLAAESLAAELVADTNAKLNKLAPCASGAKQADCVQSYLSRVGARAWRRPLTRDELASLSSTVAAAGAGAYADQIKQATISLLMSPYFLFRVEIGEGRKDGKLNGYELATRLSYFLWSSMPDAELTAAAADGSLLQDDVLDAQVTRMLQDPKAASFSERFAGQWLALRQAASFSPDAALFPNFDAKLQAAAIAQTKATFADLVTGQMAYHELFDGNTIYVNDRLAKFYGMPLPGSDELVKVPAGTRKGVLTQAATLMSQSFPNRTSLVHRGAYVLDAMLCAPPPGAPANIPPLESTSGNAKTQRQRLEAHALQPDCAVCHNLMDPYGFVLEAYDATGAYRTTDNGVTIDTSATFTDGTRVADVNELSDRLAKSKATSSCIVRKLVTYAVGRSMTDGDDAALAELTTKLLADDQRIDHLLHNIVLSPTFRRRS